ncbi:protein-L-isoaspartate(D-aspartate) O-methyltransferase [Amycolatopsis echigonensis]|uniref:Protein-L-isoaspartate O-methyltransferase n=1 Tax=Amycolatopsis echigonensis TaxID=2576905 RepID=A0A2N3X276_9PSEU|nr:methyltransferase, FxLD system [Amycolatopsis niigatensis]PKW00234.1 protein-L-isoaspartate(D-aspartate) O-methyltransferase [Amycolatopsis niigatensis]
MNETADATTSPEALRATMLAKVQQQGYAKLPEVARVISEVPRHEFVPEASLADAHNPWQAVITHRFADGTSLSCASAPFVVALMLDQLAVERGNKILEIGAGTGYNASLLAELSGNEANVVTIDVDPDVTEQATRNLAATGYSGIHVVTGDGALGVPEHAPFDRIIATVSPWDIPRAWWRQLVPGGKLVVPLRWRGQSRSVGFTYRDGLLIADSIELCGFVYLVGDDEGEKSAPITDDGTIRLHWDRDQPVDLEALRGVLDRPRSTAWSDVTIAGDEPHDGIWLRLTVTDPRVCRLNVPADTAPSVCDPISPGRAPALVEDSSLAYLTSRRRDEDDSTRWELGAVAHGPAADELARHLCDEIRAWSMHRDDRKPTLVAYAADTPDSALPGPPIDKTHSRLVLAYEIE